jgi:hypothetical protein
MAKKRVEENAMENVMIDTDMNNIPTGFAVPQQPKEEEEKHYVPVVGNKKEPISCLRNERVIVKFVPRPSSMVQNPKHILYGGMAETAVRNFVVPRLASTGMYKNVLTDNEKEFLEQAMGLEPNALSIYKKKDNFWDDSNPVGIGRVTLHKQDNYLDLSNPEDYIKYKILLANKDQIASSLQELEDRPKATYQFVIISENAEAASNLSKMDTTKRCYIEYGKIENDADTLRTVIELIEGRPISNKVKLDYLQGKVNEYIQKDPRRFLSTIKDELLPAKVLIKKSVEAGLIGKKNDTYYLRQDGSPLCEMNEESTLNNAARYISSVKRQELKYMLEAKVKEQ